jgi:hypothetical protein
MIKKINRYWLLAGFFILVILSQGCEILKEYEISINGVPINKEKDPQKPKLDFPIPPKPPGPTQPPPPAY